jgi:agmatine/peptidylarginine deiminase
MKGNDYLLPMQTFILAMILFGFLVFDDPNDQQAIGVLQECFTNKVVRGVNARELVWGLGAFHCLSQQQPVRSF